MRQLSVIGVTSQGEEEGDNRSTKLRVRGPSILQVMEGPYAKRKSSYLSV
jgi:hypothetical protein